MTDHRLAYRRLRLWLECYTLWLCEVRFGRGAAADRAFGSREVQDQIAADAERLTIEALGMPQAEERVYSTFEQRIVFELSERMQRTAESVWDDDLPLKPSMFQSEEQRRELRELDARRLARKVKAA